jgi:hypothetical protein
VTGNYIATEPVAEGQTGESIGLRSFAFRKLIFSHNTLDVDVPFDHDNRDWYNQSFIVKDSLILRGTSRENGQGAPIHPDTG